MRSRRQGTNADESDPTFKRATREIDLTEARDDLQTFVFSATLSKDLQTNLKRGSWRGKKNKSAKSNTLGKDRQLKGLIDLTCPL